MDVVYNMNDRVYYWVYPEKTAGPALVTGHIVHLEESEHKMPIYSIKRDHRLHANVGMYEFDSVSSINILGEVPSEATQESVKDDELSRDRIAQGAVFSFRGAGRY